jgi:hypothetical protein
MKGAGVGFGSDSEVAAHNGEVCFTPLNGHRQLVLSGPFRANSDQHTAANSIFIRSPRRRARATLVAQRDQSI